MKIAVLGAKGMLGIDLLASCRKNGLKADGFDLPECDITKSAASWPLSGKYDWVVNLAAYTDVDGSESNPDIAMAVNGQGAGHAAEWCRDHGARLLHISTDYVFDGTSKVPYVEKAAVVPLNQYGRSKLAGEQAVVEAAPEHIIVRTQSLFGINGRNFVRAIMGRIERGDAVIEVVSDQVSCPTFTPHLSEGILRLMTGPERGIVHCSSEGQCSWFEFAVAIAARLKVAVKVVPISSAHSNRAAKRPANSVLDKTLFLRWTGSRLPDWENGLDAYLEQGRRQA
jgi:dTDP-4-dehydrorhamnose reductase